MDIVISVVVVVVVIAAAIGLVFYIKKVKVMK